ncbi:MAG TPA: oligosaccharide flippase family protein [Flavisolibacter sp.]
MRAAFIRNFSIHLAQLASNQLFGILTFLVLSWHLGKEDFGLLNWYLALLLTVFSILSFGIDKIVVRKIASGEDPAQMAGLFLKHAVVSSAVVYLLIIFCAVIFGDALPDTTLLLILAAGKISVFLSTPFKQLALGLERFRWLLHMSVYSYIIKAVGLVILVLVTELQLMHVAILFMAAEWIELLIVRVIARRYALNPLPLRGYTRLFREAIPQAGVEIFAAALGRIDWILIGFLLTSVHVAEYSFAYKAFELSTLPLLAVGPMLIPFFTRMYGDRSGERAGMWQLLRYEIIAACFIGLSLVMFWVPVTDVLTNGKYGTVNQAVILILALAMPVLYVNNFFWTIHFAQARMKLILRAFAITCGFNIIANIVLLPVWGNEGAAIAYLASMMIHTALYLPYINRDRITRIAGMMAVYTILSLGSGFGAVLLISDPIGASFAATGCYLLVAAIIHFRRMKRPLVRASHPAPAEATAPTS